MYNRIRGFTMKNLNFYELLGINIFASPDEIRIAYLKKVKEYHPDTFMGEKETAEEMTANLNLAYSTLKDEQKKFDYDSKNGFDKIREKELKKNNKKEQAKNINKAKQTKPKKDKKNEKESQRNTKKETKTFSSENSKSSQLEENQNNQQKEKFILDFVIITLLTVILLLILFNR